MREPRLRWTDEDLGFLQDNWDAPVRDVAERLGRTMRAVYSMKCEIGKGWEPRETNVPWTADEDSVITENPGWTAAQMAERLPGRSENGVRWRRSVLSKTGSNTGWGGKNKDPHKVGDRTLIARTCSECGLLLEAKWFPRHGESRRGRAGYCRRCANAKWPQDRSRKQHDAEAWRDLYRRMRDITLPLAQRNGAEWTNADHQVLSDENLTLLEKALRLQRTYAATSTQCSLSKYKSRPPNGLGDAEAERWIIDAPNAELALWEAS